MKAGFGLTKDLPRTACARALEDALQRECLACSFCSQGTAFCINLKVGASLAPLSNLCS